MLNIWVRISHQLSPGLRQIISSVGWLSLEKILSVVINLTVGIYVIRYLGSGSFGKLSYCLSIVGMFEAIAKLGLDAIVLRNLVQEQEATSDILGTALILKLAASLFTLTLIAVVLPTLGLDPQIHRMTKVIAIALILRSSEVIEFWFRAQVLAKPMAILGSLRLLVSSAMKISLIYGQFSLMAFVWLLLAEEVLQTIGNVGIYWRYSPQQFFQPKSWFLWKFNFGRGKEMLHDSCPLILSGMMITIYMKIDQVMLGNMASNEVVGNYAAAVKFSEVWYFFPLAVCTSVFPSILRAKQESDQEYYAKLQQLYDLLAWIALAIAIIMTFGASLLVKTLLGPEYLAAGKILVLHIWAGPFVFLGVARSQWLMAENLTRLSFACTFLGTVVNLGLNFWLIPLYGGNGAAIATVISYATVSHLSCLIYPQLNHTGWMLTKALFIPARIRQNLIYWGQFKQILFGVKDKG
jgi:O-antigen/teichoic acid export membrane protein